MEASVFYSHKTDMIDWVIYPEELAEEQAADPSATGTFRSGNFRLDNFGVEGSTAFLPREVWTGSPLQKIGVQYAYIDENLSYGRPIVTSKYAMEYLRHKVVLQAESKLAARLNLSLSWRWQDRVGAGNSPYALLDGRLSWDDRHWSLYADCSNLLNRTYYDYSYIRQPGRWGKIGFLYHF
jgi:iron complex outermembrane receptor protein